MSNRKNFIVNFYYGTDLRHSEKVNALNEIIALSIAMDNYNKACGYFEWVDDSPMRLEIKIEIED